MLRISSVAGERPLSPILRLEGQVIGPWVGELQRTCAEVLGNNGHRESHLVIDLAGVSFLDADGIALLRKLSEDGVLFMNGSVFVNEQLKGVSDVNR
jgi:hypothetical protein